MLKWWKFRFLSLFISGVMPVENRVWSLHLIILTKLFLSQIWVEMSLLISFQMKRKKRKKKKILASLPEKQKTTAALLQKPNIASFWRDSAK